MEAIGVGSSAAAAARHATELDVLEMSIGNRPAHSGGLADAGRLVAQLRAIETVSGQPITEVLDALERSVARAAASAPPLTSLEEGALDSIGADRHPLPLADRPSLNTELVYGQLLAEALTTAQAAGLLGVDASRIRQRIAERTLLAARIKGAHRLPRFQFVGDGELPGWARIAPHVPADLSLVAVDRFLRLPHVDLVMDGQTVSPSEWLRAGGDPGAVARLAGE